ncbi:unnamed protein product [Cylicostephanus goldi]|uniref:Putative nuclease HARBI1 n=1 Tax=Cylicostephanus goldi TaxID=71465 RepID=A0A3P6QSR0_CYLGO|nr:unnamed protein product [Cylicostephanus goldi]
MQPWSLSKRSQVLIGIRYLCSNSHQVVLSDTMGCCQKTVSNIVTRFVNALNHPRIIRRYIVFKPHDPIWCRRRANEFARLGRFVNIVGCVDGTLVPIRAPTVDGFQYMSRKGYTCLNVCLICDARGYIRYVNAGFPGSVHDSYVWSQSEAGRMFRERRTVEGYAVLGDSGYANGGGIMAPYRPSSVRGDQRKVAFNREHCKIRSTVEMTIGRLKRRFCILDDLRVDPDKGVKIIIACSVLHNISMLLNATSRRLLGRRRGRMPHPPPGEDLRTYVMERL